MRISQMTGISQMMERLIRRRPATWFACWAFVVAAGPGLAADQAAPEQYHAQIRWTQYGVPHIRAADFGGLGFGAGYAFAEANACLLFDTAVTVRGERSKFFGPDTRVTMGSELIRNADSDVFFKTYFEPDKLEQAYANGPAEAVSLVRGYAAGANRYIADVRQREHAGACGSAAWVAPLTVRDVILMLAQKAALNSGLLFIGAIVHARPPDGTAASEPAGDATDADAPRPENGGSNALALGRDLSANRQGILLGNPHFPWRGSDRFFEMHLTIPGKLDVMGASLMPFPLINIGFNRDVAWSHTVSTGRRFTLFALQLAPNNPLEYLVDGHAEPMQSRTVSIAALQPDGSIKTQTRTIYQTRYGPVVVMPRLGAKWTRETAFALADSEVANTRLLTQWLRIDTATSVASLKAALTEVQGTPWVNTVAADRDGAVLYADESVVPDVPDALLERCTAASAREITSRTRMLVLDGARSACGWIHEPGARQDGIIPPDRMPSTTRSDYVLNSNDSYWLANRQQPLTGYPRVVGMMDVAQRMRTRMAYKALSELIAGHAAHITPQDIETMVLSDRNYIGELVGDAVLTLCHDDEAAPTSRADQDDLATACSALSRWDRRDDVESVGAAFFREFWRRARTTDHLWSTGFEPSDPLDTPAGLNLGDSAVEQALRGALINTVGAFRELGIAPDAKLGTLQRRRDRNGGIAIPGGAEFEGVLNELTTGPLTANGYRTQQLSGSSYIQVVSWNGETPVADALLTYSQSTDPTSGNFEDQTQNYVRRSWVRLPFTDAEIAADHTVRNEEIVQ